MIVPAYEADGVTLYKGEALAVLHALPDASVDALITDPPYSSGGMFKGDRQQDTKTKYVNTDSGNQDRLAGFGGDSRDSRGYAYWVALWLSEGLRIVKPGGVCALFCDWRQLPTTTDALQAGGWVWRGVGVWHKPSARPVQGRYTNACEYVVWGTQGPRSLDALDGAALSGHWTVTAPRGEDREHITQKPLKLMSSLVEIAPAGGVILDPFMGSGTTGVAAVMSDRRFIGVERESVHFEIARQRITAAGGSAPEFGLFAGTNAERAPRGEAPARLANSSADYSGQSPDKSPDQPSGSESNE